MKNLFLLGAFAFVIGAANAQKPAADIAPQAVRSSFAKLYPTASNVKWEKEGESFEAEFKSGKTESSALFDASGHLEESEMEIDIKSLPPAALEFVKIHYPNQSVKEAAKITNAHGVITYEAEIKGSDLLFDASGKFLKEVKESK
jgi:hypothetical protein